MIPPDQKNDEWAQVWNARIEALASILGKPADSVYHATIPFAFRDAGGSADVVLFPNYITGATYVTAELTGSDAGQIPNSFGNYELMICTREPMPSAADFISRLACYTCDAELESGETMDIGDFFDDQTLRAVLFAHPGEGPSYYTIKDKQYSLLLCVGITSRELTFAHEYGTETLLKQLKANNIFPYTVPNRTSVPLPSQEPT